MRCKVVKRVVLAARFLEMAFSTSARRSGSILLAKAEGLQVAPCLSAFPVERRSAELLCPSNQPTFCTPPNSGRALPVLVRSQHYDDSKVAAVAP